MHIDRQMWSLTAGVRGRVAATSGLGLAAIAAAAAQGALAAEMISRIMDGRPWSSITGLLVGEVALIALTGALIWLREVAAMWTAAGVKITLRRRLYTKLTELGPGYLERTETGKVQSTLVDGIEALEVYLGKYIPQLFVSVCGPIGILVMIALIDPLLGLIAALAIVVALTGDKVYMRLLGDRAWEHWNAYTALNATFLDSMQGMTTLKAFNASRRRGEELNQRSRDLLRATMAQMAVSLAGTGLIGMAMSLGTALTVGIGALHLANGDLSLSALLLILFLSGLCFAPLIELNAYWHQGFLGISSAVGVFEILDAAPAVTDPAPVAAYTGAIVPRLAFEGVSFGYQDGERPALDALSFTIEPGETVALVGRSGSGKSTAVALALRFFDPRAGRVTLGGHDLREYPVAAVREQMAVVSQETWLFHGTVADNLRMARPAASDAELEAAARAANAHQFIQNLEHGYQTVVGERGLKLSGGQRQRIAIARALLKDAPILILDEATASVDAANEAAIMESLERLTHGRTTLVIAHRLSTIVNADRIVVLEQGRAVESGRHLELAGRDGAYARLVAAQQPSALGGGQA